MVRPCYHTEQEAKEMIKLVLLHCSLQGTIMQPRMATSLASLQDWSDFHVLLFLAEGREGEVELGMPGKMVNTEIFWF